LPTLSFILFPYTTLFRSSFYESKGYMVDSTFFRMFTYHFKEGDPATALDQPNSLVLSEEIAKKFFGESPAINKIIHISSNTNGRSEEHTSELQSPYDIVC